MTVGKIDFTLDATLPKQTLLGAKLLIVEPPGPPCAR